MDPLLLTYGPRRFAAPARPAGDPIVAAGFRGVPLNHPVNPYSLARLMTGKIATNRTELVAAFGMPLEKILEVNGPLYNPDLAAIAARRQPPVDNAQRPKGTKASGAVDDAKPATTVKPKSSGVKISKPSTFEQKASAPIDVTMQSLAAGGVTCAAWSRMSDVARLNTLMNFGLATSMDANTIAAQVTAACSATPFTTPTTLAVRPGEATKIRDWTTQVQDPSGPAHYTESESDADLRRAMSALERAGITCTSWRTMTERGQAYYAQSVIDGLAPDAQIVRVATEPGDRATSLAARITQRCAADRSSGARGNREGNELLGMMGISTARWNSMTCSEQFAALGRINSDLVPPAVTITEMKRELWWQWFSVGRVSTRVGGGTYYIGHVLRSWFDWSFLGTYTDRAPSVTDPHQGAVGNCFFIASLASVAWVRPDIIVARSWRGGHTPAGRQPADTRQIVTITMSDPRSGANSDHVVAMSDRLPIVIDSEELCDGQRPFCHTGDNNQTWPDLYEKAMRVWVSGAAEPPMVSVDPSDPRANATSNAPLYFLNEEVHPANVLAGGNGQSMIAWIGGNADDGVLSGFARALTSALGVNSDAATVWRYLDEHCDATGKAASVLIASSIPPDWSPPAGIVPWHYYTLLGIDRARRMVYLRNPWGHISPGAPGDQRGSWLGLSLGLDDGVGAVTFQSFFDNFTSVSGNWYGTRRAGDYGLNHRWGFYSLARLSPV